MLYPSKPAVVHCVGWCGWQDVARRSHFVLGDMVTTCQAVTPTIGSLRELLEQLPPSLFINHALVVSSEEWEEMAESYPQHCYLAVNHSSPNHPMPTQRLRHFREEKRLLEATLRRPNMYYATPDVNVSWREIGYTRAIHWPNPVYLPPDQEPEYVQPPVVAIVGRDDWMKGHPSQIIAMRLIKEKMPEVRFAAVINFLPEEWYGDVLADAVGIRLEKIPWGDSDSWYETLRTGISLVLQVSLAESFNYVSVDAAAMHRPFVGAFSIRHTPDRWLANPASPEDIADKAIRILENYPQESRAARILAEEVAERQNAEYRRTVAVLLRGDR